jgi:hypothetical protein
MIHVVVVKCLIGLPLLIHTELLWRSRSRGWRSFVPTPQPWSYISLQIQTCFNPLQHSGYCMYTTCINNQNSVFYPHSAFMCYAGDGHLTGSTAITALFKLIRTNEQLGTKFTKLYSHRHYPHMFQCNAAIFRGCTVLQVPKHQEMWISSYRHQTWSIIKI